MRKLGSVLVCLVIALALSAHAQGGEHGGEHAGHGETPTADGPPRSPYAGEQDREIKALSPEEVRDLLEGRGASLALAAELNHYPGPKHVIELADELGLKPEQLHAARELEAGVLRDAKALGERIVGKERELDREFRSGRIAPERLRELTGEIGELEGELRVVHLGAHLEMGEVLTPEQVVRYDELRGYGSGVHGGRHGAESDVPSQPPDSGSGGFSGSRGNRGAALAAALGLPVVLAGGYALRRRHA